MDLAEKNWYPDIIEFFLSMNMEYFSIYLDLIYFFLIAAL